MDKEPKIPNKNTSRNTNSTPEVRRDSRSEPPSQEYVYRKNSYYTRVTQIIGRNSNTYKGDNPNKWRCYLSLEDTHTINDNVTGFDIPGFPQRKTLFLRDNEKDKVRVLSNSLYDWGM